MSAFEMLSCVAFLCCCCCCLPLQLAAADHIDEGSCDISVGDRRDCGWPGIKRDKCLSAPGCCWDNRTVGIWCFHGKSTGCSSVAVFNRVDSSTSFNKSWTEFRRGFGRSDGNYWIGNDLLHELTSTGLYKLSVNLQYAAAFGNTADERHTAEYSTFAVADEAANYKLTIGGYTGDAGDGLGMANGLQFSTYDRDNDNYAMNINCAADFGGGFWHDMCCYSCLTLASGWNFNWQDGNKQNLLSKVQFSLTCV